MTLDELDRWLDAYGRAWERQDTDAFVNCFTESAAYYWGPWGEPLRGHDEIRAKTEEKVAEQEDIRFGHEVLAITPDSRGIARWWVSLGVKGEDAVEENEGIFLVTLDGNGTCTDFREWWNSRRKAVERDETSHERASGRPWNASYENGPAPWDIGRPQPAIVRLAAEGAFAGAVLDAGCGTGENTLLIASLGLPVLGVDVAKTALAIAREKAVERRIDVEFATADAFQLDLLERRFQTVLDCGLFHTFDDDERRRYVASLASVTESGGTAHVLCFSDSGPDTGPHPVSEGELRDAFSAAAGWNVVAVEPDRIETINYPGGLSAWLATIERV